MKQFVCRGCKALIDHDKMHQHVQHECPKKPKR